MKLRATLTVEYKVNSPWKPDLTVAHEKYDLSTNPVLFIELMERNNSHIEVEVVEE